MPENAVLGAEQAQLQPPCVAEAGGFKTFRSPACCACAPDAGYQKVFEALGRGRVTYACLARMSMSDCMFPFMWPTRRMPKLIRRPTEHWPQS